MLRTRLGQLALSAALLLAAPTQALAQGSDQGTLDLASTILLARDNSLAAQISRQQIKVTEAERAVTVSNVLPTIGLQTAANYNQLPGQAGGSAGLGGFGGIVGFPQSGTTVDTTLSASQVIFDAFATRDTLTIIDANLRAATLAIQLAEQDAMANAAVGYFDVLRAEGLANVAAEALKQSQQQLKLGDLRFRSGTGTRADVLQLRAQLANAQGAFGQARNSVNLARLNLSNLVNAPVGDRALASAPDVPPLTVDIGKELPLGVARRPEVLQFEARQLADETRVSQESRALWPNITASSRYAQRNLNEGQFAAGLTLNWTLFDSFKVRNRMESALNTARVTKIQGEQARQRIALEIRQQYQTRDEASTRIATAREGLAAAQEAYRLALKRFQGGVATPFEVTDVQNTLVQSGNNFVQAINDMRVAEVRLARALGVDLGAYLAGAPSVPVK